MKFLKQKQPNLRAGILVSLLKIAFETASNPLEKMTHNGKNRMEAWATEEIPEWIVRLIQLDRLHIDSIWTNSCTFLFPNVFDSSKKNRGRLPLVILQNAVEIPLSWQDFINQSPVKASTQTHVASLRWAGSPSAHRVKAKAVPSDHSNRLESTYKSHWLVLLPVNGNQFARRDPRQHPSCFPNGIGFRIVWSTSPHPTTGDEPSKDQKTESLTYPSLAITTAFWAKLVSTFESRNQNSDSCKPAETIQSTRIGSHTAELKIRKLVRMGSG